MLHLHYPTAAADSPDAQFVAICQQMLAIHQEQDALVERDHNAPDCGLNHEQHEALQERFAAPSDALTRAAPPSTQEGIRALAQVSLLFDPRRSDEGKLLAPGSFGEWLRLFAVTCTAGKPEAIPLPRHLPAWVAAGVARVWGLLWEPQQAYTFNIWQYQLLMRFVPRHLLMPPPSIRCVARVAESPRRGEK